MPSESLIVETWNGGPSAARFAVSPDRIWTIGRSDAADIVVSGDQVSRQHLVLEHAQRDWLVRDVSSNGTWHDGKRLGHPGVRVPRGGDLRVNLGHPNGPQVRLERLGRPRRRKSRRTAIVLVVLLALLAIADRVAAHIASTTAVGQIVQQSEGLVTRPTVSFGGFPFLTQVAFGKYSDIHVGIASIAVPGAMRIQGVDAHLHGAHVPLATVIQGKVRTIPVDLITATVGLRFVDLDAFLARQPGHLKLTGANGAVRVSGSFVQAGQTFRVHGSAKLSASGGGLVVTPKSLHVSGGGLLGGVLGDLGNLGDVLASAFPPIPVPLPNLPFHLRLTDVRTTNSEVFVSGAADHVVLDTGQK